MIVVVLERGESARWDWIYPCRAEKLPVGLGADTLKSPSIPVHTGKGVEHASA